MRVRRSYSAAQPRPGVCLVFVLAVFGCGPADSSGGPGAGADPVEWMARTVGTLEWSPEGAEARAEHVAVGPGPRIYMSEEDGGRVRVFDEAGRPLEDLTAGEGGERFQRLEEMGVSDGALWVLDSGRSRVERLAGDGAPLESWVWRPRTFSVAEGAFAIYAPAVPRRFVLLRDGTALVVPSFADTGVPAPESPGIVGRVRRVPVLLYTREALVADTVAWEERQVSALFLPYQTDTLRVPVPFDDAPLLDLMADGSGVVVVHRRAEAVPTESEATFRVARVGLDRDTLWSTAVQYEPRPMADEEVDRGIAEAMAGAGRDDPPDSAAVRLVREALAEVEAIPATWPPVSRLATGGDGSIWIGREEAGDRTRWDVLDREGRRTGWVRLVRGAAVRAAGEGLVVVEEPSGEGPPRLVVVRLVE